MEKEKWSPNGFPRCSVVKKPPANAGDLGSILGLGRNSGEGNGNALQYSCLGNTTDRRRLAGYSPWGICHSSQKRRIYMGLFLKPWKTLKRCLVYRARIKRKNTQKNRRESLLPSKWEYIVLKGSQKQFE